MYNFIWFHDGWRAKVRMEEKVFQARSWSRERSIGLDNVLFGVSLTRTEDPGGQDTLNYCTRARPPTGAGSNQEHARGKVLGALSLTGGENQKESAFRTAVWT